MREITIRQKLISSYLMIAFLVGLSGWVGFSISTSVVNNLSELVDTTLPSLRELFSMRTAASTMMEASSSYALIARLEDARLTPEKNRELERAKGGQRLLENSLKAYAEIARQSEGAYPLEGEIGELGASLVAEAERIRAGPDDTGIDQLLERKEALEKLGYRFASITALAIESDRSSFLEPLARARDAMGRGLHYQYLSTAALVLGSLGFAFLMSASLSRPILELKAAALKIGRGDLSAEVPRTSRDELGDLAESFNEMARDLSRTVISKTYFDNVLSSMADMVLVTDLDLTITLVNSAAIRTLGFSEVELLGANLRKLFDPSAKNLIAERIQTELHSLEIEMRSGAGNAIPVSVSSSKLRDIEGSLIGSVFVARDMSEQKKVESELTLYRERLGRAEQLASLGTLGAIITHKFNQPLTAVRLFIQQSMRAIQECVVPEFVKENMQSSLDEVSKMSVLVKDVLRLTRSSVERRASSVDLKRVAERTRQLLFEDARKSGLKLEVADLKELPPLHAVEAEIEEIFFILVQNAIQAAKNRPNPTLNINAVSDGQNLHIRFADTCGGIASEHLDNIFDTFFTTRSEDGGTGLGLAILKQIVTNHNGEVSVDSELGKGTTFLIKVPLEAANG
jgi:PAS domain S-box-containing protein